MRMREINQDFSPDQSTHQSVSHIKITEVQCNPLLMGADFCVFVCVCVYMCVFSKRSHLQ